MFSREINPLIFVLSVIYPHTFDSKWDGQLRRLWHSSGCFYVSACNLYAQLFSVFNLGRVGNFIPPCYLKKHTSLRKLWSLLSLLFNVTHPDCCSFHMRSCVVIVTGEWLWDLFAKQFIRCVLVIHKTVYVCLYVDVCIWHWEKNEENLRTFVDRTMCREKLKINASCYHPCFSSSLSSRAEVTIDLHRLFIKGMPGEEKAPRIIASTLISFPFFLSLNDWWNWPLTEKSLIINHYLHWNQTIKIRNSVKFEPGRFKHLFLVISGYPFQGQHIQKGL